MKFEIHTVDELATALRAAESGAPQALRPLLLQAANEINRLERLMADCARELTDASAMKAGYMDSDSRHMEVANVIRRTVVDVATRLYAETHKRQRAA